MEHEYQRIKLLLESKKTTHPHLTTLWNKYITTQRDNFCDSMKTCKEILERLDDTPDLNNNVLIALLILNNSCNDLNSLE